MNKYNLEIELEGREIVAYIGGEPIAGVTLGDAVALRLGELLRQEGAPIPHRLIQGLVDISFEVVEKE